MKRQIIKLLFVMAVLQSLSVISIMADNGNTYRIAIADEPGKSVGEDNLNFKGSFFDGVQNRTITDLPANALDVTKYAEAWDNRTTKISFPYWIKNWDDHVEFYEKGSRPASGKTLLYDENHYKFDDINLKAGDKLRVYVSHNGWRAAAYAKAADYNNGFPGLINGSDCFYIGGASYYEMLLNQAAVDSIQMYGLCLGGFEHKIIGVYIIPSAQVPSSFATDARTVFSGKVNFQEDAKGWKTGVIPASCFTDAKVGDKITIGLQGSPTKGQLKMSTGGQMIIRELYVKDTGLDPDSDGVTDKRGVYKDSYDLSNEKGPYFGYIRSKTLLRNLQEQGLKLEGWGYDISSVQISHDEANSSDLVTLGNVNINPNVNYQAGKWYGFVFPYDIIGEDKIRSFFNLGSGNLDDLICIDTLSTITYVSNTEQPYYKLHFKRVRDYNKVIRGNFPYIVQFKNTVTSLSLSESTLQADERGAVVRQCWITDPAKADVQIALNGIMEESTTLSTNDFYFASGKLYRSNRSTVKGGRSYIDIVTSGQSAGAKVYLSTPDFSTSTGISSTEMHSDRLDAYNLQGQRLHCQNVSQLPKGVYIINGHKMIKK